VSDRPVLSIITGLPRPTWRGRIHTWAFWATLPAVAALILAVDRLGARIGTAIYGASLVSVYGVSAAYHRLARSDRAQRMMRRLDHSMIFVLIAGTYTPVCLAALPPVTAAPLLMVVWGLAALGVAGKVWGTEGVMRATNSLYLVIGWLAVVILPVLWRALPPAALALLVLGGGLYTAGAVLFYLRRPDPAPTVFGYHEVWHAFTVAAGLSHFVMVALVVQHSELVLS
jgi:hemolysin III